MQAVEPLTAQQVKARFNRLVPQRGLRRGDGERERCAETPLDGRVRAFRDVVFCTGRFPVFCLLFRVVLLGAA